jgi:hypothetical protein
MKKDIPSLAVALLLIVIAPANAIPVYGTFSGAVTATGGTLVSYPIGTAVTGNFEYASDMSSFTFVIDLAGQAFAGWGTPMSGLAFSVDANGFPVSGTAAGPWDLYISSGGGISLNTFGNNFIHAQVSYTTPEGTTTFFLLSLAWAGVAWGKRCFS